MIVSLKEYHVPEIASLERECFSDPWPEEAIRGECFSPISLWLVAEEEGRVVGYVGSQMVPPEADVMNLAIAPDWRRKGLGNALMSTLTEVLHSRGITTLFLEVRVSNAPARALYDAMGFVQVGRRPKYYVNPSEDALILRKELAEC